MKEKIRIIHRQCMEIRLALVLIYSATTRCEVIVCSIMMSGVCARSFSIS